MKLFAYGVYFIYALAALAALGAAAWAGKKLKKRTLSALFTAAAWQKMTAHIRPDGAVKTFLFFSGVLLIFTALARPQWGIEVIEAQGSFAQTVIAVDVSTSMRAQDLKPNRLANAKSMLNMLLSQLQDERVGIIAFTSQAYVQCPITTDEDALKYFISTLQPDMLPVPGTSLAAPVKLAAHLLGKYPGHKALILLTDGEDHSEKDLQEALTAAQKSGIRIIAVGIGTAQGELIPVKTDASGKALEYKKDKEGRTVVTKLDEKPLVQLAQATGGVYIKYTTPAQVAAQAEKILKTLDRSAGAANTHAGYKNRYQAPLALGIVLLGIWLLWPARRKPASQTPKKVK